MGQAPSDKPGYPMPIFGFMVQLAMDIFSCATENFNKTFYVQGTWLKVF